MTILVTGGAGFIGSNFIYMLLEERPDWKNICVDALTYSANIKSLQYLKSISRFIGTSLSSHLRFTCNH